MAFLKTLDISASGMTAQRMRMDTIAQNIANASVTRDANGQPYRRRVVLMGEQKDVGSYFGRGSFAQYLNRARSTGAGGVIVTGITEDTSPFKMEYDPEHPDANADGYVQYPNVDEVAEMVDMMAATRAFEANVTAFNATKSMALKSFEIGK